MTYYNDINNAIKTMHYRHGIGDIKEIRRFADGKIEVIAKGYGMKPHSRKGYIIHNGNRQTIHLYRHQLTVTIV